MSNKALLVLAAASLFPSCALVGSASRPVARPVAASVVSPSVSTAAPLRSAPSLPEFSASYLAASFLPAPWQRSVGVERQNLNLILGQKRLSDSSWDPNDNQQVYGLLFDYYRVDQLVGLDAGLMYSTDDSDQGIGQTTELFLGARKTYTVRDIYHPYVAAGISYLWGTNGADAQPIGLPGLVVADQGESGGFYLRGGAYATLAEHVNVGLDLRTLQGTSLGGLITDDADGFQLSLTLGWGF